MKMKPSSVALVLAMTAGCSAQSGGEVVGESGQAIVTGAVYNFGTLANPGSCMDAEGAGTADGTQIQEYVCNGTGAQSFSVQDAGNGAYYLVNTNANKCVDVNARGTANGTKIQLYDCNQTTAQTFTIQPEANGFVSFVNTNSGKCLDVTADNPANGTLVQLYDCNGTNAQLWNPAVISGGSGSSSGGTTSGSSSGGSTGSSVTVQVTNGCPIDLWIHGVGQESTLQPDNQHLAPGASQTYAAPLTWTAARIYAYMQAPDSSGNPQGENDKVEMNFGNSGGVESLNTDITYVDWVALPSQIQTFGSGSDCTTVGCEVPYSQVLNGCPSSLLTGQHECLSAGNYCLNPVNSGDPLCHELDSQISACASEYSACSAAAGSTTAEVYSCSGSFFSGSPQYCAALNRGVLSNPGPNTPASEFYQTSPYNPYSAWVHNRCPGIYAFPYDDYGSSNQSSDHTCSGATQMNVTFCPKG
jgi:hypothetical protein